MTTLKLGCVPSALTATMLIISADAAFPPAGPLLVVSPHFDDAAFSSAALLERGEPATVLTVCAGEPDPPRAGWWDVHCGFESSAESLPARRREDVEALREGGHRLRFLDLLEAQYVERARPAEEADRIAEGVRAWLAETGGGSVALPAGAGWAPRWLPPRVAKALREPRGPEPHADHVFTRDAVLRADGTVDFVLYEELPYLWGGSASRAARRAAAEHGYRIQAHTVPIDREAKARRIAAYDSQIPFMSPPEGRLDSPEVLPPTERYWQLRRRVRSR
jgi:LmbE family N-acetylglucosaminyl deacetylase